MGMIAEATLCNFLIVLANIGLKGVLYDGSEVFSDLQLHIGMYPLTVVQQQEGEKGMSVVVNSEEFQSTIASRMKTVRQDGKMPANVGGFNFLVFSDVVGVNVILAQSKFPKSFDDVSCAPNNGKTCSIAKTASWKMGIYHLLGLYVDVGEEFEKTATGITDSFRRRHYTGLPEHRTWIECGSPVKRNSSTVPSPIPDFVTILSRAFNFSYTYVEPADQSWGIRHPNGTWDGIIGMRTDGNADISPVPYGLLPQRSIDLTFSHPVDFFHTDIIYKKPAAGVKWGVLLLCFQWQIYALGFAVMVWVVVVFHTLKRASEWLFPQRDMQTDNIFVSITINRLTSCPVQFLVDICIVTTSVYSGNLIAYLAVAKDNVPFTGIGDVLESGYNSGVNTGTLQESSLKDSSISLYKRKILEHRPYNMTVSEDETFHNNQLDSGRYALITSVHNIEKCMAKRCDMVATKEKAFQSYVSLPFPKQSVLVGLFDPEILSLVERGLSRYWLDLATSKRKQCATERQDIIQREDLYLVFVTTEIGIALGTVVLVVEHCILRQHRGRDQ